MTSTEKRIAFKVEFSRILELLADQIYQSPLALLRENTQNAFDAILMRKVLDDEFEPMIRVTVDNEQVSVSDNGVGMTAQEIETHFWYAGKSGKNTDAARAAGVVGTFGIGAMANFGIADKLSVESESAATGERTSSSVQKSELSTETQSILVRSIPRKGEPGTTVRAHLTPTSGVSVQQARTYLREFVEFVDLPVFFNGEKISGSSYRTVLPSERHAWSERHPGISLAGGLSGDLELLGMASGELRVILENVQAVSKIPQFGSIVLLQGHNAIRTFRSGFGLSTVAMRSRYQWGGVVDLSILKPTAGREALDASSNQMLQKIITALDSLISPIAATHPESFVNDGFLRWIAETEQFTLCGPLEVTPRPSSEPEALSSLIKRGGVRYYSGRDESVIQTYASEEEPLVVLSRRAPRRNCEFGYLTKHGISEVDTTPRVEKELPRANLSLAHSALATRLSIILEEDYFLPNDIRFGSISGGLSLLVTDTNTPVMIYFDPDSTSIAPLLALYDSDYNAFSPFVKDFVRSAVFPRIANLVPSSRREGAEAFLRHLRSNRELFEYEFEDKADLEEIFEELRAGRLTTTEAAKRLTDMDTSFIDVSSGTTAPLSSIVDEIAHEAGEEESTDSFDARPGIDRREEETNTRILTSDAPVNGYTCFLSLSDRVQREKGDFFLQPHSTQIVWGGRKVIFIFQHHSGRFGLYYDILCPGLVGAASGGGLMVTSTIIAKDRTFIPIPEEIANDFLPEEGERKRLEVRCDILYAGEHELHAQELAPSTLKNSLS